MRLVRLGAGMIVALVLVSGSALAQDELGFDLVQLDDNLVLPGTATQDSEAKRRSQRTQYLNELVAAIEKSCKLDEAQARKLKVAAKGAVEYSLAKPKPANRDSGRLRLAQARLGLEIRDIHWAPDNLNDVIAAASHPIWKNTLQRMLTAEQLAQVAVIEQQIRLTWASKLQPKQILWGARPRVGRVINVQVQELQPVILHQVEKALINDVDPPKEEPRR